MSRATPLSSRTAVTEWNVYCQPGTDILFWPGSRDEAPRRTRTRTLAEVDAAGQPVLWVHGYAGSIALSHVELVPGGDRPIAVQAPRKSDRRPAVRLDADVADAIDSLPGSNRTAKVHELLLAALAARASGVPFVRGRDCPTCGGLARPASTGPSSFACDGCGAVWQARTCGREDHSRPGNYCSKPEGHTPAHKHGTDSYGWSDDPKDSDTSSAKP